MLGRGSIIALFVSLAAGCGGTNASSSTPLVTNGENADAATADSAVGGDDGPCGCDAVVGYTAHQGLSCFCGSASPPGGCSLTLATYNKSCGSSIGLSRTTGCGRVTYIEWGLSGQSFTFDATTGALVGITQSGDVPWGECNVLTYAYGDTNDGCPSAQTCKVCGALDFPPCQ